MRQSLSGPEGLGIRAHRGIVIDGLPARFVVAPAGFEIAVKQLGQSLAESGLPIVGLQLDGSAVARQRLIELAEGLQNAGQVVVGLGVLRAVDQCAFKAGGRLVQPVLRLARVPQIVVRLGQVRLQLEGTLIAGRGLA